MVVFLISFLITFIVIYYFRKIVIKKSNDVIYGPEINLKEYYLYQIEKRKKITESELNKIKYQQFYKNNYKNKEENELKKKMLEKQKRKEQQAYRKQFSEDDDMDFALKNSTELFIEVLKKGYTMKTIPKNILLGIIRELRINKNKTKIKNTQNIESEYFKLLEIDETNDLDTIKKAYRKLMKLYHPDKLISTSDEDKSKKINEAYSYFVKKPQNII